MKNKYLILLSGCVLGAALAFCIMSVRYNALWKQYERLGAEYGQQFLNSKKP